MHMVSLQNTVLIVLAVISAWALRRLYKRWKRRCGHCGSMRYRRWHDRQYERITSGGKALAVSTTYQRCLNPHCHHYFEDIEVKSYPKEFPIAMTH